MAGQTDQLIKPGSGHGLLDVYGDRFLLKLLVRKEIKVRYRGSVLGLLWSYVKPLVQFLIYFVALGIFLNLQRGTPNYAIYLFSGIVLVNFFTESLSNATRSIVDNRDLIRKIYLPRELFPVATVWVSAAHFLPQLLVLVGACLVVGWAPTLLQLAAVVLIFVMVAVLGTGLGLLFGAVNVYFRDSENIVDMIVMVVTWASPVLYLWSMVQNGDGRLVLDLPAEPDDGRRRGLPLGLLGTDAQAGPAGQRRLAAGHADALAAGRPADHAGGAVPRPVDVPPACRPLRTGALT